MSMDEPASSQDVRDTDMSDAASEDPDLALGNSFMLTCALVFLAFIRSEQEKIV